MRAKQVIASMVHQVADSTGYSLRRAKALPCGRIIMFHGIGDDIYSAADFEDALLFLSQNFSIISLEEFVSKVERNTGFDSQVVLTFDDGLRNNLKIAYPLLRKFNAPATFFICPGLVTDDLWLWNHEARVRLKTLSKIQLAHFTSTLDADVQSNAEAIVTWMKTLPLIERNRIEANIRAVTQSFVPTAEQHEKYDLMNWDELKSLDPSLITIGSHTVNHPILSTLNPEQLNNEVGGSRCLLEKSLGRKIEFFCYPNGAQNANVATVVRNSYRAAVTTIPAFVQQGADVVQLPRIGIVKQPLFSWRMFRPGA